MLPLPKVGDKVILHAIVADIDKSGSFDTLKLNFIDCDSPGRFMHSISINRINEIIPAPPPIPKVGDIVYTKGRNKLYADNTLPRTLIAIHQEEGDVRKWGVVSYKGDIPYSVYFEDLRTEL